jgi:hypothetical protein
LNMRVHITFGVLCLSVVCSEVHLAFPMEFDGPHPFSR